MTHASTQISISPHTSQLLFFDRPPRNAFEAQSHDWRALQVMMQNLAKAAAAFQVPMIISTFQSACFSCLVYPSVLSIDPNLALLERDEANSWSDPRIHHSLALSAASGRRNIVISGHWLELTDVSATTPQARAGDYDLYTVISPFAAPGKPQPNDDHNIAFQPRVTPLTWQHVLLEWYRNRI